MDMRDDCSMEVEERERSEKQDEEHLVYALGSRADAGDDDERAGVCRAELD